MEYDPGFWSKYVISSSLASDEIRLKVEQRTGADERASVRRAERC
eukprot:SAG31_NODE_47760_length_220_cov_37.330579_2_plen_44_part_01